MDRHGQANRHVFVALYCNRIIFFSQFSRVCIPKRMFLLITLKYPLADYSNQKFNPEDGGNTFPRNIITYQLTWCPNPQYYNAEFHGRENN